MFRLPTLLFLVTLLQNTQQLQVEQQQVMQRSAPGREVQLQQAQQQQIQHRQMLQQAVQQLPTMQQISAQQQPQPMPPFPTVYQQVQNQGTATGLQLPQLNQAQLQQLSQNQQFLTMPPGVPAAAFPHPMQMPAMMAQNPNDVPAPNLQYVGGTPTLPVASGGVPDTIDLSNIDASQVSSLVDNGELPDENLLAAIFSAPSKLGAKLPPKIRELKIHILDRISKNKELWMKAMETKQDAIVKEIADLLFGKGEAEEENKEEPEEKDDDPLYEKVPKLPLTVGFDPFLQKPKPSFFGRTRDWFSGWFGGPTKPDTNVGNFLDNRRAAHNSFEREGSGWGRSTVYYPPLKYSSHLIPVASGAMDLKTLEFRPYKNGHPRITKRRFVTRIILRKNNSPSIRVPQETPRARRRE